MPLPKNQTRTPLPDRFFELLIAARLLRSRRSVHLSLVTAMSVAGIALGVAALIVVLAVNTGFQAAFQDRILATYPHLVIMRRGVDLRDYRDVANKLNSIPSVRNVSPATYDDMMLSAAMGRAGAIVRGVPLTTLKALPEGAIVAGHLDEQGELPVTVLNKNGLQVSRGVSGARHVLVVGGPPEKRWLVPVAVVAPGGGIGQILVFDANGCGQKDPTLTGDVQIFVNQIESKDTVRRGSRSPCAVVGSWELGPGAYNLRWFDGGQQKEQTITVLDGQTTSVILHNGNNFRVPGPSDALAISAAAVAVVNVEVAALALTLPEQISTIVKDISEWQSFGAELPTMMLGEGLAKRLQVKIGDEVRAVSPMRGIDRGTDQAMPSASGRFTVSAILRTGFHDHDQRLALTDFTAAQRFLARGDIARWIEVRVVDPILAANQVDVFKAALEPTEMSDLLSNSQLLRQKLLELGQPQVAGAEIRAADDSLALVDNLVSASRVGRQIKTKPVGNYRVIDWEEMNRNIFDAARMQKIAMSLFPFIIVLVAALNVVGTQAVVVHERAREIAILRAMGATRRSVAAIFLVQGLAVGLFGTFIGLLIGGLSCLLLDAVGYPLDPQVYLISRLPVLVEPASFFLAGGAATLLAFAAAWFSAQRAASRAPVDALRRLD